MLQAFMVRVSSRYKLAADARVKGCIITVIFRHALGFVNAVSRPEFMLTGAKWLLWIHGPSMDCQGELDKYMGVDCTNGIWAVDVQYFDCLRHTWLKTHIGAYLELLYKLTSEMAEIPECNHCPPTLGFGV